MTPKMMSIHHELHLNRQAAIRATHTWGTYRISKKGTPSRLATTTHATQAQAETKAQELETLNAGTTYVAKAL